MTLSKRNPWADNAASLRTFPDHVLVDIARNDAAQHDYRKLAVEVLFNRKSEKIKHPDLQQFVHELEIELDGIVFEHPAPGNPLIASITTETMSRDYLVENQGFIGFNFEEPLVPTETEPPVPTEITQEEADAP